MADQTLQGFDQVISEVADLNTLAVQKFALAESRLEAGREDCLLITQSFQGLINRLAEVQAAEEHLAEAERLALADLARAENFRDQEDRKITPAVDEQLSQARDRLNEGEQFGRQRHYLAAVAALAETRALATEAFATANEQVRHISALQVDLKTITENVAHKTDQMNIQAKALPAPAKMDKTIQLVEQTTTALSKATQTAIISADLEDQAWLEALRDAVATYDTARRRANEALSSIKVDRDRYNKLLGDLAAAIRQARAKIQRAESVTGHYDAGGAGKKALRQAKSSLPRTPVENASMAALKNMLKQARAANDAAARAEDQARRQIRATRAKRERQRSMTWTTSSGSSSSSSWGSSSSSSSGSSSFGSSSRSSSFGSSSSRSSSMGSSRRR